MARGWLPEPADDRRPAPRRGGAPWGWIAVGAVGALVVVSVINVVLGVVFGLIRLALIGLAVVGIAWLLLIGPPTRRR
jgi:hypothetical protein